MPNFPARALALAAALLPLITTAAPLTLDAALDLAVQRSQSARAARAGATSAAETARAAAQAPDPMLSVGVDNLPVTGADRFSTTADSMTMKRIGISQEWLSSNKRSARQAAAQAIVEREAWLERAAFADTRLQTALAYLDAFYASEALKLTTLSEHHLHEEFEASRARLASNTGNSQDVLAMASARGVAEDDSAEARQAEATSKVALQRWVGQSADELVAPAMPATPSEDAFVAQHPAVIAAQREREVARQEVTLATANRQPNWSWQVSYGQRTGFSDMVSVGVNIPLPVSPAERQDREIASRVALVDKAEAALTDATRVAGAEYRALLSDAQRLAERVERYRSAVLTPAQQRTQAALAGYRSNQISLATLFEARHAEVELQRKLLKLQRELARTQAQLAFRQLPGGAL